MSSAQQAVTTAQALQSSRGLKLRNVVLLVLLWAVVYIPGLFTPPLMDDADSVHAEAAREMVLRGDWVTLYANGVRYLEKAPFMYWTMAASFTAFGTHEWSARLPLVLGMLAAMFALYAFGRRAYNERAGFYAAIVFATGFGPFIYTRALLIPEVLVCLWLTLAAMFFVRSLEEPEPSRFACWGFAAVCALNVLTKGLIGVVFPVGIFLLYLLVTRDLKRLLRMRLLSSTLVFLAIAAPWHIIAGLRNPAAGESKGFFWFYFINEHVLRFLGKRFPKDYDTVPLLLFWFLVIGFLLPWAVNIVQALAQIPRRWRDYAGRLTREQRASLLCAVWMFVIIGFFSFSTRQEYYHIPALPALALLIGAWMSKEADSPDSSPARRHGRLTATILFVIGIAGFVAAMLVLREAAAPPAGYDLAELLTKNPDKYALSMGHMFDLTPEAMGAFRLPLIGVAIGLLTGTAANFFLRRRGQVKLANCALTVMMVVLLGCASAAFATFAPVLSSKQLADVIQREYRPGDVIVIDGEYESGSSINFYTGIPLHLLNGRRANMWYGSLFPDAPKIFETDESFAQLWTSSTRVFFWSDKENPPVPASKPARVLVRRGGKAIYVNF